MYEKFKINRNPWEGYCRLILDDDECDRLAENRGLCKRCQGVLARRGILEKYALPRRSLHKANYKIDKDVVGHKCRILTNGKKCRGKKYYSRGLCVNHYKNFHARGTLEKFALKSYKYPKRKIGVRDYDYSEK